MIIWPPKGLAGSAMCQNMLNNFFDRNPNLTNLSIALTIRGHPTAIGYHIILGPTIVREQQKIASFITNISRYSVKVGPFRDVDGDGFQNWISFSRDLRSGDPRTVSRICLLGLLNLNNLIAWPETW